MAYCGSLFVDYSPSGEIVGHFYEFIWKVYLDINFILHLGMDGPKSFSVYYWNPYTLKKLFLMLVPDPFILCTMHSGKVLVPFSLMLISSPLTFISFSNYLQVIEQIIKRSSGNQYSSRICLVTQHHKMGNISKSPYLFDLAIQKFEAIFSGVLAHFINI